MRQISEIRLPIYLIIDATGNSSKGQPDLEVVLT